MKKFLKLVVWIILFGAVFLFIHVKTSEMEYKLRKLELDIRHIKEYIESVAEIEIAYTLIPAKKDDRYYTIPIRKSKKGRWILEHSVAIPVVGPFLPMIFREKKNAYYLHTMIVARNPVSGQEFYISAGESGGRKNCESQTGKRISSVGSSGRRCCKVRGQLCAVAEILDNSSTDKKDDIIYRQKVNSRVRYFEVIKGMKKYSKQINQSEIDYDINDRNCNTFSSEFMDILIGKSIVPDPRVDFHTLLPGWRLPEGNRLGLLDVIGVAGSK